MEFKIGTIGTGEIVRHILSGVRLTEGIHCEAVYSRSREKGEALAKEYEVGKVYTDLEEMLQDKEVNCVYVASPNNLHYEQAKKALEHGKHVICEKPFTTTLCKARELVELAHSKHLFLIDAVPPSFQPNFGIVQEQLSKIGRIRLVMSNFSQYSSRYDLLKKGIVTNVFDPAFAGGCLQDIGFYNLYLNVALFGKPKEAAYYANIYPGAADTSGVLVLQYEDFVSSNVGAKDTWGVNFAQIEGEEGYLYIKDGFSSVSEITVVTREGKETFNEQMTDDRWFYEVQKIAELTAREDFAECDRRLDVMLSVIETLEKVRREAGLLSAGE